MEPWFDEAKSIPLLEAEICFLLQDDFYVGPESFPECIQCKEVVPLPSPAIPRLLPSGVGTSEAIGHERELAEYYQAVLGIARAHGKNFNDIAFLSPPVCLGIWALLKRNGIRRTRWLLLGISLAISPLLIVVAWMLFRPLLFPATPLTSP